MDKINLDKLIAEYKFEGYIGPLKELLMGFADNLLKLAAENAMVSSKLDINGKQIITENTKFMPHPVDKNKDVWVYADKQSILDTIKQVRNG